MIGLCFIDKTAFKIKKENRTTITQMIYFTDKIL